MRSPSEARVALAATKLLCLKEPGSGQDYLPARESQESQVGMEVSLGGGSAPQCHPRCLSEGEILSSSPQGFSRALLSNRFRWKGPAGMDHPGHLADLIHSAFLRALSKGR